MIYLLLFLSICLATALVVVYQQLKQSKNETAIAQQHRKEADQKYGGLISKEDTARELDSKISALRYKLKKLDSQAAKKKYELTIKISSLESKLQELEEQDFLEDFGFYESKYDFREADEYKQRLDQIRTKQKQMIKDNQAAVCHTAWTVSGSARRGEKMTNDFLKLVLRAFNGECDTAITKVKYNNIQTMENRIKKVYKDLNKLSETTHCEITPYFFDIKLQELYLTHEYKEKKYQEKEEQRLIREQMREEERAVRELEKARQDAEKEERRYQEALKKARKDVDSATGKAQEKLHHKIAELQNRLAEAEANKERAISQAQMTKSGHVYVISNIGSFGEGIYKIGMTRRLNPLDRVKELGDASVPFAFDVHAMISCKNAPDLESNLHKRFRNRQLNKVNSRKEFFRVSLDEIVKAVQEIDEELKVCKSEVKFTKVAEASEYRKTMAKERKNTDSNVY